MTLPCPTSAQPAMSVVVRRRPLAPAPPRGYLKHPSVNFFDLPAELRVEIYKLSLEGVRLKILLPDNNGWRRPHPLAQVSKQVRREVLPLIHALCPIRCDIENFNFDGLLLWTSRIPPDQEVNLCKNASLTIQLVATETPRSLDSMRRWLHMRADRHRPQPPWMYKGPQPAPKVCADLRRRTKRMREAGKQREMMDILRAIGVPLSDDFVYRERRVRSS